MKPEGEKKQGFTTDRLVKPECKNASNPYHVCDEYCLENVLVRDQPGQVIRQKSSREARKLRSKLRTVSLPLCKHRSNPYHECTALCFQSMPDNSLAERDNSKGVAAKTHKRIVRGSPEHASGPFHKINEHVENPGGVSIRTDKNLPSPQHNNTEHCSEDTFEKEQAKGVVKPEAEREVVVIKVEHVVNLECKNASNPSHVCTEYCFQNLSNSEHKQATRIKSSKETKKMLSNRALMKLKDDNKEVVPIESIVNSQCKYASNPYHVCAEYCLQTVAKGRHLGRAFTKMKEEKIVVFSTSKVNSVCKNASNPYHVCTEYCSENILEMDRQGKTTTKSKEKVRAVLPSKVVNPDCKFASNPYHACAEYCFQNVPEGEQRTQVMKLKGLKELKKLVSNKKITSGHPQCRFASNPYHECTVYCITKKNSNSNIPDGVMKTNVNKKEDDRSPRNVNPSCKHASNPFNICPEYSSEVIKISSKNEEVEGIKETFMEKRRNSLEQAARHDPNAEKDSPTSGYRRIILQNGAEKGNTESKHVDASKPSNSHSDTGNGKDLQSDAVEMKKLEEFEDVQSLQLIRASYLFQEWAKYCSQTKIADEDEIVMQENIVGMGESSTRNGKELFILNDYDSAKLEKVLTPDGFPRSLPISLLLFLGFLFAAVYWIQVIQSLVMSSEKNQGYERLKVKGNGNHKCREASDPYHNCSECCFQGSGEDW